MRRRDAIEWARMQGTTDYEAGLALASDKLVLAVDVICEGASVCVCVVPDDVRRSLSRCPRLVRAMWAAYVDGYEESSEPFTGVAWHSPAPGGSAGYREAMRDAGRGHLLGDW